MFKAEFVSRYTLEDADELKAAINALELSFRWNETEEGSEYWEAIRDKLLEQLEQIPAAVYEPRKVDIG